MPDGGRDPDDRPTLTPEDGTTADDGTALAPDELDIEDDENVVSLNEGRYVIGTDERPDVQDASDEAAEGEAEEAATTDDAATQHEMDSAAVKQFLEDDLTGASARYGFHVTAKSEDAVSHQQMVSDDVGTVFDSLLRWYAQQLTTETAVEDVLGILLTESNVRVRYSPSCLQAILEAYDLGPDDSIADLVEAVQDDRGMVFPPENV
jgi:hypothetical protein